jgi:hypothetical protein
MNRVATMIDRMRPRVAALDAEAAKRLDEDMAVDFSDHFAYQEEQARAHVEGKISLDEAQICYIALGEVGSNKNGGWDQDTDTATKVTVTKLIGELLSARVEGRTLKPVRPS